jgi:divalent metal cation (Fe/Co/Zn/Cd) transporter
LFVSGGLLLSEILNPFQTLMNVLPTFIAGNELLLRAIMYYSLFLGILLLVFIIVLWVSILMFGVISKGKNIFIETANNNLSDVLLFSAIMIALIYAVNSGLIPLLDLFIPYPELPTYY